MTYPKVSAIIVNYRSSEHAIACVRSLREQQNVNIEILVVDNASGDGSVDNIRLAYPDINLIENPHNDGFAKANNLAALQATGEFILAINPDIRLLETDGIARLVMHLLEHSEIGVVGPDLLESRRNKRVMPKRFYPMQKKLRKTRGLSNLPGQFAWLLGACMLFRTEVYRQVGGFDNNFFLYGEDTDICLRLRQAGYIIAWLPDVKVDHWGGASESGSRIYDMRLRKKRGYYQFCLKHYDHEDVSRLLRWRYLQCSLNLWVLTWRKHLNIGQTPLVSAIERNQAERDVLRILIEQNANRVKQLA